MARLDSAQRRAAASAGSLTGNFLTLSAIVSTLGIRQLITDLVDVEREFERVERRLLFASGPEAGRNLDFIREASDNLGRSFLQTGSSAARLFAAARTSAIATDDIRTLTLGVLEASTALNLTTEETEGIFFALDQVVSKNRVSSEELRRQLGDRLTGSFQLAANAVGITTAELTKLLESGQLVAEDFLPLFATALRQTFGPAAAENVDSITARVGRLETRFADTQRLLSAELAPEIVNVGNQLLDTFGNPAVLASIADILELIGDLVVAGADVVETLAEIGISADVVAVALGAVAASKISNGLVSAASASTLLSTNLASLGATATATGTAVNTSLFGPLVALTSLLGGAGLAAVRRYRREVEREIDELGRSDISEAVFGSSLGQDILDQSETFEQFGEAITATGAEIRAELELQKQAAEAAQASFDSLVASQSDTGPRGRGLYDGAIQQAADELNTADVEVSRLEARLSSIEGLGIDTAEAFAEAKGELAGQLVFSEEQEEVRQRLQELADQEASSAEEKRRLLQEQKEELQEQERILEQIATSQRLANRLNAPNTSPALLQGVGGNGFTAFDRDIYSNFNPFAPGTVGFDAIQDYIAELQKLGEENAERAEQERRVNRELIQSRESFRQLNDQLGTVIGDVFGALGQTGLVGEFGSLFNDRVVNAGLGDLLSGLFDDGVVQAQRDLEDAIRSQDDEAVAAAQANLQRATDALSDRMELATTSIQFLSQAITAFDADPRTASQARAQNQAIGSGLGGLAGGLIGFLSGGGAAGASTGASLGSLVGGIFGGLFGSDSGFNSSINFGATSGGRISAGATSIGTRTPDDVALSLRNLAETSVASINSLISSLGGFVESIGGVQLALEDGEQFVVTTADGIKQKFEDEASAVSFAIAEILKSAVVTGLDPIVEAGLANTDATSFEQLAADLQFLNEISLIGAGPLAATFQQLSASLTENRARVFDLLSGTDQLSDALGRLDDQLIDSLSDTRDQILGITRSEYEQRLEEAESFNQELQKLIDQETALLNERIQGFNEELQELLAPGFSGDAGDSPLEDVFRDFAEGVVTGVTDILDANQFLSATDALREQLDAVGFEGLEFAEILAQVRAGTISLSAPLVELLEIIVDAQQTLGELGDLFIDPNDVPNNTGGGGGNGTRRRRRESLQDELDDIINSGLDPFIRSITETRERIADLQEETGKLGENAERTAEAVAILEQQLEDSFNDRVDQFGAVGRFAPSGPGAQIDAIEAQRTQLVQEARELFGAGTDEFLAALERINQATTQQLVALIEGVFAQVDAFDPLSAANNPFLQIVEQAAELERQILELRLSGAETEERLAQIREAASIRQNQAALGLLGRLTQYLGDSEEEQRLAFEIQKQSRLLDLAILEIQLQQALAQAATSISVVTTLGAVAARLPATLAPVDVFTSNARDNSQTIASNLYNAAVNAQAIGQSLGQTSANQSGGAVPLGPPGGPAPPPPPPAEFADPIIQLIFEALQLIPAIRQAILDSEFEIDDLINQISGDSGLGGLGDALERALDALRAFADGLFAPGSQFNTDPIEQQIRDQEAELLRLANIAINGSGQEQIDAINALQQQSTIFLQLLQDAFGSTESFQAGSDFVEQLLDAVLNGGSLPDLLFDLLFGNGDGGLQDGDGGGGGGGGNGEIKDSADGDSKSDPLSLPPIEVPSLDDVARALAFTPANSNASDESARRAAESASRIAQQMVSLEEAVERGNTERARHNAFMERRNVTAPSGPNTRGVATVQRKQLFAPKSAA